jgi:transcriptional regulator with XRE-family HTH domain
MLAEALRLIRVFHDMKQQELAERLGLSKSYVSELESGKKVPSIEVIQKYSDTFDIPAS